MGKYIRTVIVGAIPAAILVYMIHSLIAQQAVLAACILAGGTVFMATAALHWVTRETGRRESKYQEEN